MSATIKHKHSLPEVTYTTIDQADFQTVSAIMASLRAFSKVFSSRSVLTTATCLSVVGTAYYITTQQPIRLDSAYNPPTPALSFPKTMLFSQQLRVTKVEQVNHDTKRITFELPGGSSQVSGIVPGGQWQH